MLGKVETFIASHGLLAPGDTVVVAVSGGADSVALLDILWRFRHWPLTLVVAHLNHGLRGAESDGDEEFVRNLAASCGLRAVIRRADVTGFSREAGVCLEEGGRICRYRFFADVAAECGGKVALGHHRDDQAETVLMRLIRGSGGSGLGGMRPLSPDGHHVRPLLGVSRQEIETYLRERNLGWRLDSSNDDTAFLRNRIRHELLPLLATYNPAVIDLINVTASALAADEEVLEGMAEGFLREHAILLPGRAELAVARVRGELKGLRMRLYRAALRHVKGDLRQFRAAHLEAVDRIVRDPTPHQDLHLPGGIRVGTSYDRLFICCSAALPAPEKYEISIGGPGTYPLPNGFTVSIAMETGSEARCDDSPWTARFDPAAAPFPWTVRPFRDGDRLSPFGMTGNKKVKELFQEHRVPREERRTLPLLFCGETLIWVTGVRRSSAAPVGGGAAAVVSVSVTRE